MNASRSILAGCAILALTVLALIVPQVAMADGLGLMGKVTDKQITFFCFGVIAFFPILITVLSLIQGRLEARKDRRRYDLERFS